MPVPNQTPEQIALLLPAPEKMVLRCLADIQRIELRDGESFDPPMRFHLVQEHLAQRAELN